MHASPRRHPIIGAIAVTIAVLLVWGFWPKPVLVEAVNIKRAPLTVTIEEEGRTRVIDRFIISAPVDGVTCEVTRNVGDPVRRDEMLLEIAPLEPQVLDPRSRAQAQANVEAAASALRAAEESSRAAAAPAHLAATELRRLRALLDKGLIAREAYDKTFTEATRTAAAQRSADFQVEVARYQLQAARSVLDHTAGVTSAIERVPILSPVDGRILKVLHECEGPVRTGHPLLEVGDPSALEVEVDVLSADAVKIKPGMKVLFERWGGDYPLQGVVRIVEPVGFTKISALGVEEQRVLIISDFTSPREQWQSLGDGYRVEARFMLWEDDAVLQVPTSSLFRFNEGWAVFVIENGRAVRRVVKTGRRTGLVTQILDGVRENQLVISHPSDAVEDGRRVIQR